MPSTVAISFALIRFLRVMCLETVGDYISSHMPGVVEQKVRGLNGFSSGFTEFRVLSESEMNLRVA